MSNAEVDSHLRRAIDKLNTLLEDAAANNDSSRIAALATANTQGVPSVRTITVMDVSVDGLLFFTNINSGKGQQLLSNPVASLCFYWPNIREQVIAEGDVVQQSDEVADIFWNNRMREDQLAAWCSDQSAPIQRAGELQEKIASARQEFSFERIARPESWQGFRLQPWRLEFWPTGWQRAKDRCRYTKNDKGIWHLEFVNP